LATSADRQKCREEPGHPPLPDEAVKMEPALLAKVKVRDM